MEPNRRRRVLIQASGILSMVVGVFLPTQFHDEVINVSGFFGLMSLAGVFVILWKSRWIRLFRFGIFNLLLFALNNIMYHAGSFYYLPAVQKITFLSFLIWSCMINLKLYQVCVGKLDQTNVSIPGYQSISS